jgi:hypothetical protein
MVKFNLIFVLLGASFAWAQNTGARLDMVSQPVQLHAFSSQITERYTSLHTSLRSSAQAWVDQQAKLEAERPAPDLGALRAQIRSRFSSSLSSSSAKPGSGQMSAKDALPAGADIEALVFVVMMQATENMDQDLQQMLTEVKAETAAKQKLRNLQNEIEEDAASGDGPQAQQVCRTFACASIPSELRQLAADTAHLKHPISLAVPPHATYGQIQQVKTQISRALDSLSDISQQQQLQLQTLMDRRSQFEETLSNLMKSQQDTSSSIVSNLK